MRKSIEVLEFEVNEALVMAASHASSYGPSTDCERAALTVEYARDSLKELIDRSRKLDRVLAVMDVLAKTRDQRAYAEETAKDWKKEAEVRGDDVSGQIYASFQVQQGGRRDEIARALDLLEQAVKDGNE
jgi:hypothetical protein